MRRGCYPSSRALGPSGDRKTVMLGEIGDGPVGRRVTALTHGRVRVDTQLPPPREVHRRRSVTELLTTLQGFGTGLLISVDKIHAVDRSALSELAAVIQHPIR